MPKNNLIKQIKDSYDASYGNPDLNVNDVKSRLMFKEKVEKTRGVSFMKKKSHLVTWLVVAVLVIAVAVAVVFIAPNKGGNKVEKDATELITVDHNPTISLATDENGIVLAAYGDNDEGKMIVSDEKLVGLKAEVALDKILKIQVECGYFVKEENSKYNNLTISVSAEASPELEARVEELKTKAVESLKEVGINVQNQITALKNDAHAELVKNAKALGIDEAELNEKTDAQIIALMGAQVLETSKFPTKEIEELYNQFKNSEIKLANYEAINEIEGGLKTLNAEIQKLYKEAQTQIRAGLDQLDAKYEELFINKDSEYQKKYAEIKAAKAEVLKLRAEVDNMEEGAEKSAKLLVLSGKETALNALELALNTIKEAALKGLEITRKVVETAFSTIDSYLLSNDELQKVFDNNKAEVEKHLNATKDEMFEKFEAKYADQIKAFAKDAKAEKQNLINNLKEFAK